MAVLANLARMTTATTGTGTITLGSAVSGFLTFAQAGITTGQTVSYAIEDGVNREVGRGVYTTTGTTLTRTVLKSTNSNAAINLSGTAQVFISALAEDVSEAYTLIGNYPTTTGATVTISAIPSGYKVLLVEFIGVSSSSSLGNFTIAISDDGTNFSATAQISATNIPNADVSNGQIFIYNAGTANAVKYIQPYLTSGNTSYTTLQQTGNTELGVIQALRFGQPSNFDAGSINLYGLK